MQMNFIKRFIILQFIAFIMLGGSVWAECSKTILVGSTNDWWPYQYKVGGEAAGVDVDMVRAILDEAGCHYKMNTFPWARLISEVEYGRIDLMMGASITKEREKWGNFSVAYRNEDVGILVRAKDFDKWNSIESFSDLKKYSTHVTMINGGYYGELWEQVKKDFSVTEVTNTTQAYRMLMAARVDFIFADPDAAAMTFKELNIKEELKFINFKVLESKVHLLVNKKSMSQQDLKSINNAISSLQESKK